MGRTRDVSKILTANTSLLSLSSASATYAPIAAGSLVQIIPTTVSTTGGSATSSISLTGAVTFATATEVSLNGVFSSTYDNYRIVYNNTSAAGNEAITIRLRASGTDTSANYVSQRFYTTSTTVAGVLNPSGTDEVYVNDIQTSPSDGRSSFEIDMYKPNISGVTNMFIRGTHVSGSTPYAMLSAATQTDSTQFTGFTLRAIATFGGTIRVYGLRN